MTDPLRWLAHRYTYRGCWLILTGAAWWIFGAGVLLYQMPPHPFVLYTKAPAWLDATGWLITGAIAVWQGSRVTQIDSVGHMALYAMPMVRAVSYASSVVMWSITATLRAIGIGHSTIGWSQGWYPTALWLLVILLLTLGARWPNPKVVIPQPPDIDR